MIWALSPYFESVDDGEGGQYKCAPIFAVSLDQLAAQVSEILQVHKPLKAQSFGSVKSICSVPRGTSEREEGVLCSLLVGTSSGYLILVDLMSTNTSLVPATVSSASSQASERSLVPVQSVHSSIRWCHRVSSSALAQLLCVGGDTGEIAIGVQCGQQCLLLPLSGPSVSDKQLIGGERQMMGSVGSGIVSGFSLSQQLGSDGESGTSPFSLIAGTVDGVIHRWTCSLSESRMTECFPSFPLLACGPVISGLCVDPLNFMGTCVSKSTDNSKRFGNPLVQRVCLAPLPSTSLTSLRDIATLTLVLRRVLNRVAVAPHVSLASLLMFLKYELSRLSDPLRQRHFPETETRTTVRGTDDSITIVEALSMGADSIGCEGLGEVNGSSGGDQGSSFTALLDPPQGLDRKRKTLPVEESCSLKGREEIEDADEEEDFVQALQTIANTSFLPLGREFRRAGGGGGSSAGGLVSAGDGAVMLAQAMLRAAASLCGHDSGVEAEELTGGLMGEQEDVAYCVRAATALLRIPSGEARQIFLLMSPHHSKLLTLLIVLMLVILVEFDSHFVFRSTQQGENSNAVAVRAFHSVRPGPLQSQRVRYRAPFSPLVRGSLHQRGIETPLDRDFPEPVGLLSIVIYAAGLPRAVHCSLHSLFTIHYLLFESGLLISFAWLSLNLVPMPMSRKMVSLRQADIGVTLFGFLLYGK